MSIEIKCQCGQSLGWFEGKFDIRCRCKKIVKGETIKIGAYEFALIQDSDMPEDEIHFRLPNKPDQVVKIGPNPWPKKLLMR